MSRSIARLNSSARLISAQFLPGLLAPPRTPECRHYVQAALKSRPAESARRQSSSRPIFLDDAEPEAQSWNQSPTSSRPTRPKGSIKYVPRGKLSRQDREQPEFEVVGTEASPVYADHLSGLFPGLNFPPELGRRILTHGSHPAAVHGHNAGLSFIGRRVLESYLLLLLSSSPNLQPSHDLDAICDRTLNAYVLGEHLGSQWGLGRVMRWTPSVSPTRLKEGTAVEQANVLKSAGLYKVQGDAVAAVMGGVFVQFGAAVAHRFFHTRVLSEILLNKGDAGLPKIFHSDARIACNRMGGVNGRLILNKRPSQQEERTRLAL